MFSQEYLFILFGFLAGVLLTYFLLRERLRSRFKQWKLEAEDEIRKDALKRSRAVLKGKIGEHLAPFLPEFDFEPADSRFMGNPIDYLIFKGYSQLDEGGEIEKVVFADVKTGESQALSSTERKIKDAVENGNVEWETIRVKQEVNEK
ncbi:MAG: Holliday junction resolvase [Hadesarchaea archaeon]|nr:Holliday junction resolvase [Hadesarchaea archaeon]